jgi:SAM-dependent MidA family methyltransferase
MESNVGLRRIAGTDLDAVESDPALVERIRVEIERDGPLTFARFMDIALYDPDGGYYRGPIARPGRGGDFLTAPEAHPIFGRALARHVDDVWRALGEPAGFTVREHGAGGGALAAAVLEGLAAEKSALAGQVRYRLVDAEPRRVEEAHTRLAAAGHGDRVDTDDGDPITGLVIANEVLDALPTHRVVRRGDRTLEVHVGLDGDRFVDIEADPSTPALEARLRAEGIQLADGQRGEVCLALDGWIAAAAAGLGGGVLLLIDYGHPAAELYDARRRREGTAMAYLGHVAHDDFYRALGRQDLTAHVDVTAVERAANAAGLESIGITTQGPFLAALGAGELLVAQQGNEADLGAYLETRAALVRMIDPAAMGGFRVMAFGRSLPAGTRLRGLG